MIIPCGTALIRRGQEFLIARRKEGDTFGLYWEFPGGKKNADESFEECVRREVKEELGVNVRVGEKFAELRRRYHGKIIWLNFYLCDHVSGTPQALECQEFRWTHVRDLKKYRFPPANHLVIERLEKRVQSRRPDAARPC